MVTGLDGVHDPTAARDAALILLGYTAALRRSELAALSLADITEHLDGAWIEVFIAISKTAMGVFRLHPDNQRIVAHSGLYQQSLAPSDHGDNTPQIINNKGNKSCRGRPATPHQG